MTINWPISAKRTPSDTAAITTSAVMPNGWSRKDTMASSVTTPEAVRQRKSLPSRPTAGAIMTTARTLAERSVSTSCGQTRRKSRSESLASDQADAFKFRPPGNCRTILLDRVTYYLKLE